MVEDLDRLIADTAAWFNDTFDPDAVTLPADVATAIEAFDAAPLAEEIPPGLSPGLETAALAVYADLESRVAALHGAVRFMGDLDDVLFCLGDDLGVIDLKRGAAHHRAGAVEHFRAQRRLVDSALAFAEAGRAGLCGRRRRLGVLRDGGDGKDGREQAGGEVGDQAGEPSRRRDGAPLSS